MSFHRYKSQSGTVRSQERPVMYGPKTFESKQKQQFFSMEYCMIYCYKSRNKLYYKARAIKPNPRARDNKSGKGY